MPVPTSWAKALFNWNTKLNANPKTTDDRVLIVQGYGDAAVQFDYNIEFIATRFPATEVFYIAGAKHDLFQETEAVRNRVYQKIISFLEEPVTS